MTTKIGFITGIAISITAMLSAAFLASSYSNNSDGSRASYQDKFLAFIVNGTLDGAQSIVMTNETQSSLFQIFIAKYQKQYITP